MFEPSVWFDQYQERARESRPQADEEFSKICTHSSQFILITILFLGAIRNIPGVHSTHVHVQPLYSTMIDDTTDIYKL
jgi:hypothetical protein